MPPWAALGVALPSILIVIGASIPASDAARVLLMLGFVASGALIGRWWGVLPSLLSWTALAAAEEANHLGIGPGTRFGTAFEIHSGGDFSWSFFAFTSMVAIALPAIGLVARRGAGTLLRQVRAARG